MRLSAPLLGEALLAVAITAVAVSLVIPRGQRELPGSPPPAVAGPAEPQRPRPASQAGVMASPERIASLFGWRKPVPPRPKPAVQPPAPRPVPPRLKLVGFVESADATVSWVFKDAPTGIVLTLSPGETARGWTLVEVKEQEFVLSFQGVTTTVPRKR